MDEFVLGKIFLGLFHTIRFILNEYQNSNNTELEQVVHTHQTSCRRRVGRESSPVLTPENLLSSQWVSSPLSHLFTFSTVRIYLFTLQQGVSNTKPCIRYATLHFRDRRDPASLRYTNRTEITVLM